MKPSGRSFILRLVLGLAVFGNSLALLVSQFYGSTHATFLVLAVAELVASALFLFSRTLRLGGVALIAIFAFAAIFHLLHHQYNVSYLVVYGAAAWAVISEDGSSA